jgi:hypothetical protein
MDADDRRRGMDVAKHERHAAFHATNGWRITGPAGLRLRNNTFKTMNAEMPPAGREVGFRYLADHDGGHI